MFWKDSKLYDTVQFQINNTKTTAIETALLVKRARKYSYMQHACNLYIHVESIWKRST